jgi:hypothetical protein
VEDRAGGSQAVACGSKKKPARNEATERGSSYMQEAEPRLLQAETEWSSFLKERAEKDRVIAYWQLTYSPSPHYCGSVSSNAAGQCLLGPGRLLQKSWQYFPSDRISPTLFIMNPF